MKKIFLVLLLLLVISLNAYADTPCDDYLVCQNFERTSVGGDGGGPGMWVEDNDEAWAESGGWFGYPGLNPNYAGESVLAGEQSLHIFEGWTAFYSPYFGTTDPDNLIAELWIHYKTIFARADAWDIAIKSDAFLLNDGRGCMGGNLSVVGPYLNDTGEEVTRNFYGTSSTLPAGANGLNICKNTHLGIWEVLSPTDENGNDMTIESGVPYHVWIHMRVPSDFYVEDGEINIYISETGIRPAEPTASTTYMFEQLTDPDRDKEYLLGFGGVAMGSAVGAIGGGIDPDYNNFYDQVYVSTSEIGNVTEYGPDDPPEINVGPYVAAGGWPLVSVSSSSPTYLSQNVGFLWGFTDDYASCGGSCSHTAEYSVVGSGIWVPLAGTAGTVGEQEVASAAIPVDQLQNATTYAFRFSVTDCAGQTTPSAETYYFRVARYDHPPIIGDGPYIAAGPWVVLNKDPENAHVLKQNYDLLWTFNDDYASCSGICTHVAEYQRDGDQEWTQLAPVVTDSTGMWWARVGLPVVQLQNGTYKFRFFVTDCAGQTTQSDEYYFKVSNSFWAKAATHIHTINSVGKGEHPVDELIPLYQNEGYDIIAITDDNPLKTGDLNSFTPCSQYYNTPDFLCIESEEFGGIDFIHIQRINIQESWLERINCVYSEYVDGLPEDHCFNYIDPVVTDVNGQGGFAVYEHPNAGMFDWPFDWIIATNITLLDNFTGMEIYNRAPEAKAETAVEPEDEDFARSYAIDEWDVVLNQGKRIFGFAVDDMRSVSRDFGFGWLKVYMENYPLTNEEFVNKVRSGHFYATQGPTMDEIPFAVSCGENQINMGGEVVCDYVHINAKVSAANSNSNIVAIRLVKNGVVIAEKNDCGSSQDCDFSYSEEVDSNSYYRLEAVDNSGIDDNPVNPNYPNRYLWSNPIWVNPTPAE